MTCTCGHRTNEHTNNNGRCNGTSYDPDYGQWKCVCPMYRQDVAA